MGTNDELGELAAAPAILDLRNYVQYYDGALTPEFSAQLVSAFEQSARLQVANGRGHQAGLDTSSWTEVNVTPLADTAFIGFFHAQIDKYLAEYNRKIPLTLPIPNRPTIDDLRIKRYRAGSGDNFQPHFDSIDQKCGRYLVFLWYLNDVAEGGETEFVDIGIKVAPRAGRLLMFPPYWMFQHAGRPPISNDKYIISTYLMF
ncbi:MAG TPA: 2OG-Fe(II) oxygenase [Rudaea sp.]